MSKYVERSSEVFHAIRLDNAHGTPLHVTSYLIDKARKVNKNILVLAELFTGDDRMDKIFIETIGINLLLRESLQAQDPFDLSRLLHISGGSPIGSIHDSKENIEKCRVQKLPVLFYDCTHDNEPAYKVNKELK